MTVRTKLTYRASALAVLFLASMGSLASIANAQPRPTLQQLQGQRPQQVATLTPVGRVSNETQIDVAILLKLPNEAERDTLVRRLYDPTSPQFHEFLTPGEYQARFAPSRESYQAVLDFARQNQLTVVATSPNRQLVHLRGSAAAINAAFHVTLQLYEHPTDNRKFYAPDREPSVALDVPIKCIVGLDDLHPPGRIKRTGPIMPGPSHAGGSGSNGQFTGNDFRKAYAAGVTLTGAGQTVGILQLDGYDTSDITTYEQKSGLPNVPIQNVYLDGYSGANANAESPADIELAISMAPGLAKLVVYGVPYTNPAILDALTEMANPTKGEPLPYQISTSYYFNYEKGAVYGPLAQLAIQGQALSVASGDYGSYNESTGAGDFPPVDDPNVTAVGGTVLTTDTTGAWSAETTWVSSGGGFSPWSNDPEFKIPLWQAGLSFASFGGSSTMRNAPDIAMVATNISLFYNGAWNWLRGDERSVTALDRVYGSREPASRIAGKAANRVPKPCAVRDRN
jgi:subtilase family serine protease